MAMAIQRRKNRAISETFLFEIDLHSTFTLQVKVIPFSRVSAYRLVVLTLDNHCLVAFEECRCTTLR
jgi:hypothetical protein